MSPYAENIKKMLASLGVDVSADELARRERNGHDRRIPVAVVVPEYFEDNPASIDSLMPLMGDEVSMQRAQVTLEKPYLAVSNEDWQALRKSSTLYHKTESGRVVTFGRPERGYCLMPLAQRDAERILRLTSKQAA